LKKIERFSALPALRVCTIKSPGDDLLDETVEQAASFTIVDSARSFGRSGGTEIAAFETCRVAR